MAVHAEKNRRSSRRSHRSDAGRTDMMSQMGRMLGNSVDYIRGAAEPITGLVSRTGQAAVGVIDVTRRVGVGVEHAAEAAVRVTVSTAGTIGSAAVDTVRTMVLAAAAGMETFARRTENPQEKAESRTGSAERHPQRTPRRRRHRAKADQKANKGASAR